MSLLNPSAVSTAATRILLQSTSETLLRLPMKGTRPRWVSPCCSILNRMASRGSGAGGHPLGLVALNEQRQQLQPVGVRGAGRGIPLHEAIDFPQSVFVIRRALDDLGHFKPLVVERPPVVLGVSADTLQDNHGRSIRHPGVRPVPVPLDVEHTARRVVVQRGALPHQDTRRSRHPERFRCRPAPSTGAPRGGVDQPSHDPSDGGIRGLAATRGGVLDRARPGPLLSPHPSDLYRRGCLEAPA